eukprot:TRINITY_DN17746_c0_g1_i2.p1 TRINITY_DN17746_c0_g1~~TRINITY_DN17746_c0_g1_i2.p1  ORF type:complete len:236 (+),score=58.98 TRINITY_DN17746_c0_g1_i2:181-888(+)
MAGLVRSLALRVVARPHARHISDQARNSIKAFAAIPQRTLPSLQALEPAVILRASDDLLQSRNDIGETTVSEADVETFLVWHGATSTDIEHLFNLLRTVSTGVGEQQVDLNRFIIALSLLGSAPWSQKVQTLFRGFDQDDDGVLTRAEVQYAMTMLFKVAVELAHPNFNLGPYSKTRASVDATAEYITELTFQHADLDGNGVLDADEFATWITSESESSELFKALLDNVGAHRGE